MKRNSQLHLKQLIPNQYGQGGQLQQQLCYKGTRDQTIFNSHVFLDFKYPFDDYHGEENKGGIAKTPDHDVFYHLATTYTANHATMNGTEDCPQWGPFEDGVTNGAEWYESFLQQKVVALKSF